MVRRQCIAIYCTIAARIAGRREDLQSYAYPTQNLTACSFQSDVLLGEQHMSFWLQTHSLYRFSPLCEMLEGLG